MHENLRYEHGKPHTGCLSVGASRRARKSTTRTRKARTRGATWLPVNKGLGIEGSVID